MFEKQNIQETVNELKSDAVKGLTDGEAFRRLQQNGRNEMKAARKKTKIQLFLEQLKDPLIYILLIAAVVSVFLGELSDAVIIGTVVVVNALVGMLQEGKARKALEALKKLTSPQTIVIMEAILPISVAMPVAVTIPSPWPWVTTVDIYTILTRSANGISCLQSARNSASFSTGTDSPVRADSSTSRLELLVSRISAGTCAPASRSTRSPVTSSAAGIS